MYSIWSETMLALRLPPDIEKRLEALAKRTGRTKSFYAREAIIDYIQDMEDTFDAREALALGDEPLVSLEQVEERIKAEKALLTDTKRPMNRATANAA
jgi:RHH-type transcriptional regulator, rel operon repressor / antitoxin RelB